MGSFQCRVSVRNGMVKLSPEFEIFSSVGRFSLGESDHLAKHGPAYVFLPPYSPIVLVLELVRVGQRSGWNDLVRLRPSNRMVHAFMRSVIRGPRTRSIEGSA